MAETNGGPLIVVESRLTNLWSGIEVNTQHGGSETDDQRACAIQGYTGAIDLNPSGVVLILNDEPLPTIWVEHHQSFLRWSAAELEEEILTEFNEFMHNNGQEAVRAGRCGVPPQPRGVAPSPPSGGP